MVEKFDFDSAAIGQEIDPEGEKKQEEDNDVGIEDAEEYAGLNPDGLDEPSDSNANGADYNIRLPDPIDMDSLLGLTRKLVSEQQTVLGIVVEYCKDLQKNKKTSKSSESSLTHSAWRCRHREIFFNKSDLSMDSKDYDFSWR